MSGDEVPPQTNEREEQRRREDEAMRHLLSFPFVDALFGRRSRRFFRGASIPDGPLAYTSRHEPVPLTELERLLVLTAMAGNTGGHHSSTRHDRYAPHLANYPGAAGGRTNPSAVGFHTAELFFTDDSRAPRALARHHRIAVTRSTTCHNHCPESPSVTGRI